MLQSRGLREPANRCGIATELIHGDPIGCITQVTEQGKNYSAASVSRRFCRSTSSVAVCSSTGRQSQCGWSASRTAISSRCQVLPDRSALRRNFPMKSGLNLGARHRTV